MIRKPTFDAVGRPNGWLGLIWRRDEQPELAPDQVYVTAVAPGCCKGPHAHRSRSCFVVIQGDVRFAVRETHGQMFDWKIPDEGRYVPVSPGEACAIYNVGTTEALILNLKSPVWTKDDDMPVEGWVHPEWWKPQAVELEAALL